MEPNPATEPKPSSFGAQNKLMDSMQASRANDSDRCVSPEALGRRKGLMNDIAFTASPNTFRDLVTTSDNFIDKSELIEELEHFYSNSVVITRPHGWGKTLNIDMIKSFYEIDLDSNGEYRANGYNQNKVLFEGGRLDPNDPNSRVL